MSDGIYFNGGAGNGGADFDTEAFKKRFNEVLGAETQPPKAQPAKPAPQPPAAAPVTAQPKKKKKHVFLKILCILLALVLLLTGAAAGTVLYVTKDYTALELKKNEYVDEKTLTQSAGVTNILLMGIDTKNTQEQTRSDSMILLSVDTVHGKLKLTSFMRDMYVPVPGHGTTKLTHACAYAGPQLTVDTIEMNFGVKIDGYVKIGYSIFVDLVNGIGGITVPEIDEAESKALAKEGVNIAPGTNIHLNGHEALNYCRIRKGQSDFHRTARQREAITLIIKQAMKTNPLTLLKLARTIAAQVESSIEKTELVKLALQALPCLAGEIEQLRVPADGTWEYGTRDGMSVLLVDIEKNKAYLKESIY